MFPIDKKRKFENGDEGIFIKSSDLPSGTLSIQQKALLNRKANIFFNEGNYQAAQRIYITTGYSDGLTRIGDILYKKGEILAAFKQYLLARNKQKSEIILVQLANLISKIIKSGDY